MLTASISIPPFLNSWQFGVCSQPCTEIAVSNVPKGFLYGQNCPVLISLDLSVAFTISDHAFLEAWPSLEFWDTTFHWLLGILSDLFDSFSSFVQLWKYCSSPSFWSWCSFIHKHIFTDGLNLFCHILNSKTVISNSPPATSTWLCHEHLIPNLPQIKHICSTNSEYILYAQDTHNPTFMELLVIILIHKERFSVSIFLLFKR